MLRLSTNGKNIRKRLSYRGTWVTFEQVAHNDWQPIDGYYKTITTKEFNYRVLVHNNDNVPTEKTAHYINGGSSAPHSSIFDVR